jgi:isochorismate hydrolase
MVQQTPARPSERTLFDRLCERIDDFDYLTLDYVPASESQPEQEREEQALDELILAGLVTPV